MLATQNTQREATCSKTLQFAFTALPPLRALTQGNNTVPPTVRLAPATHVSRVNHYITDPPRSSTGNIKNI